MYYLQKKSVFGEVNGFVTMGFSIGHQFHKIQWFDHVDNYHVLLGFNMLLQFYTTFKISQFFCHVE